MITTITSISPNTNTHTIKRISGAHNQHNGVFKQLGESNGGQSKVVATKINDGYSKKQRQDIS